MTNRSGGSWDQLPGHSPVAVIAAITLIACAHETTAIPRLPVRISIAPQATSLIVGEAESFTAQAFDAKGIPTGASFSWSSSDPTVASVEKARGVVTAISVGTASVTATTRTLSGSATVIVLPPGPARLSTSTSALGLIVGWVDRITAQVFDARDRPLAVAVEWSSSSPAVATVGRNDGVVTAIGVGTTTVSAKVGTLTANVTVSVIEITGSITFARHSNPSSAAFTSNVLVYSTRDSTLTPLSHSGLGSIAAPTWSPDGTLLAVEVVRSVFYDDYNHWGDYESDLHVLGAASSYALTTDGQSRAPSWSPDGTRIAFVKRRMLSPGSHIYIIGAGGGAPVRLTQREGSYSTPRWSPDGARLAFADDTSGANRDVFIMNADGTGLTNVSADAAYDAEPAWSPDGTRLAFVSNRSGSQGLELFVTAANGGNARRVTSLGGWIAAPIWSPDGRLIVFTLARSPNRPSGVYVMSADGSFLTRLISTPANALDLAFAWRPAAGPASFTGGVAAGASIDLSSFAANAANAPLAATMQFGQPDVGAPFPPSADHDESSHAKDNIVPRTVVIDRGGTVTFVVPSGVHQIAIYAPGKEPRDINTTALIPLCPGSTPRVINDTNGRLALITHACGSAWEAQYTFDTPGRYLVICAFLPHFEVGMYGWVEVRDRGS